MDWRPIETAPKDGRAVLLCQAVDADGKPITGESFNVFCQVAMWWGDEEDGEWTVYCSLPTEPRLHFAPTHWAPIIPPGEAPAADLPVRNARPRE